MYVFQNSEKEWWNQDGYGWCSFWMTGCHHRQQTYLGNLTKNRKVNVCKCFAVVNKAKDSLDFAGNNHIIYFCLQKIHIFPYISSKDFILCNTWNCWIQVWYWNYILSQMWSNFGQITAFLHYFSYFYFYFFIISL